MADTAEKKPKKRKGPIRYEAIVPVLVLWALTYIYFSFYFDHHLKKLVEYVGTQANGAEVNVDGIRTSFIGGSFDLDRLQVTDAEKPSLNSLEIGNVHFGFLWDALLRAKFVVEEASINNIMLMSKRSSPGHVLPPSPAKPSKMEALQAQVMNQVKNKYGGNVLGDVISLLEGGDPKAQLEKIRGELKSEARIKELTADVNTKKAFWDGKVKELSDTSKLKSVETQLAEVRGQKNFLKQAEGIKKLTDLLKDVQQQYKEIESSSKQLQNEVKAISAYPKEVENLVKADVESLKGHFQIPKIDFKDMAMHLFAGEFADKIAKARKYQALAKQYLPEKKEEKEEVIPPKRTEGKSYVFPVTTGYPLFWLKKAAISSQGTKDSYSGNVSGTLTNVTTSPKQIMKPVVLDLQGDFPATNIHGVKAVLTADFTHAVGKQSALIQVNSFGVPEKMFTNDKNLKFGLLNAVGSSTIRAELQGENVSMNWISAITHPKYVIETQNKIASEILNNVVNNIPVINLDGTATGTFANLNMHINSNLGTELASGFSREIGNKLHDAQAKLTAMVDEKINQPKEQLLSAISGNNKNLTQLGNLEGLYKQNQDKIETEIAKLKTGGSSDLKEKGKSLFKKIKF
ncbi:MAG: TIGR03545 family protein [Bacteriovoracaceae bacterium]